MIISKRVSNVLIGDYVLNHGLVMDKMSMSNGLTFIKFEGNNFYNDFPTKSIIFIKDQEFKNKINLGI